MSCMQKINNELQHTVEEIQSLNRELDERASIIKELREKNSCIEEKLMQLYNKKANLKNELKIMKDKERGLFVVSIVYEEHKDEGVDIETIEGVGMYLKTTVKEHKQRKVKIKQIIIDINPHKNL